MRSRWWSAVVAACLVAGPMVGAAAQAPLATPDASSSGTPGWGSIVEGVADDGAVVDVKPGSAALAGATVLVVTDAAPDDDTRALVAALHDGLAEAGAGTRSCRDADVMECLAAGLLDDIAAIVLARRSQSDEAALADRLTDLAGAGMTVIDAMDVGGRAPGVITVAVRDDDVDAALADAAADRLEARQPGDDVTVLVGPDLQDERGGAVLGAITARAGPAGGGTVVGTDSAGELLPTGSTGRVVAALGAAAVERLLASGIGDAALGPVEALVVTLDAATGADGAPSTTIDRIAADPIQRGEVAARILGSLAGGRDVPATVTVPPIVTAADTMPTHVPTLATRLGPEGQVDLGTALQAWVDAFGPLPGLDLQPVHLGADAVEGSMAIRWVRRHSESLTDEQRAAVDAALQPTGNVVIADPAGGAGQVVSPDEWRMLMGEAPVAGSRGAFASVGGPRTAQAPGLSAQEQAVDAAVRRSLAALAEHGIGLQPGQRIATTVRPTDNARKDLGMAEGIPTADFLDDMGCVVSIFPSAFASPDPLAATVAHEVWHCLQYLQQGLLDPVPDWIVEGQAAWVEVNLLPEMTTDASALGWREDYLLHPMTDLRRRSYDAIGFYSQLATVGRDPYQFMLQMIVPDSVAAYRTATDGWKAYRQTAGSALFRSPAWGAAWETGGNALPSTSAGPVPHHSRITPGRTDAVRARPFTDSAALLLMQSPVVRVRATGDVRMGDRGFRGLLDEPDIVEAWLCSPGEADRTGCVCHHDEAVDESPVLVGDAVAFGLVGHLAGARVDFKGFGYDDYCREIDGRGLDLTACDLLFPSDVEALAEGLPIAPWSSMAMGVGLREGMSECGFHSTLDDIEGRIAEGLQDCFTASDPDQCSADVMARFTGTYRDVQVVLLTSTEPLGELLTRANPRAIPQLGPQAELVIDSFLPERPGTGFDSSAEAIEFPCGRRSCLVYGVAVDTPPAGSRDRLGLEILTLATTIQQRARKLPPTRAIVRRP